MNYDELPKQTIMCMDMKSFYASCSAVCMELDPLEAYIAVVGDIEREGSIVLAASPRLKKEFGIKTGSRYFEIPKDPRIHVVHPKMGLYLRISTEITRLINQYVPKEDIHVYSVDECFIRVDSVKTSWKNPVEIAMKISDDIMRQFGLPCAIGIGPNMLLSKLCLDLDAKKVGIAEWKYEDVPKKLWPISPLREMWGIGRQIEKRLNRMGIFSVGDLARYSLESLEKHFGVMGNQLYYHAWGIDLSQLGEPIVQGQISFGKSQMLLRDYYEKCEIECVLLEICEEVARRARTARKAGRTVQLGIGYSRDEGAGGFQRSVTLPSPTNVTKELYEAVLSLFYKFYEGSTVRKITISLSNIVNDTQMQLSLLEPKRPKLRKLGYTMDKIRSKYGYDALLWAVSYTSGGTAKHRSTLIGGHKAT